jgi:hypothetical protein
MADSYVLWDRETANVLGAYASRSAALGRVRRLVEANGGQYASDLMLFREDANGVPSTLVGGFELALEALGLRESLVEATFAAASNVRDYLTSTRPFTYRLAEQAATYAGSWDTDPAASTSVVFTEQVTFPADQVGSVRWSNAFRDFLLDDSGDTVEEPVVAANKQSTLALAA